jgi:hypothetical protein
MLTSLFLTMSYFCCSMIGSSSTCKQPMARLRASRCWEGQVSGNMYAHFRKSQYHVNCFFTGVQHASVQNAGRCTEATW